jgi:hypothetical protein
MQQGMITICSQGACLSDTANFDRGLALVEIPSKCGLFANNFCNDYGYIDTTGKLVFKF